MSVEETYKAYIYALASLTTRDHRDYDPRDVGARQFFVVARPALAQLHADSIGRAAPARLAAPVGYDQLATAIIAAANPSV